MTGSEPTAVALPAPASGPDPVRPSPPPSLGCRSLAVVALLSFSTAPFELTLSLAPALQDDNLAKGILLLASLLPPSLGALWVLRSDALRALWATLRALPAASVLCALAVLSLAWSESVVRTVVGCGRLGMSVVVAVALARRLGLGGTLVVAWATSAVLVTASAALAVSWPEVGVVQEELHHGAWRGPFAHKNTLGAVAGLAIVLGAWRLGRLWRAQASHVQLGLAGASSILAAVVLLGSRSVGGLAFTLLASLAWIACVCLRWLDGTPRRRRIAVAGLATLLLALVLVAIPSVREAVLAAVGRDSGMSNRTTLWWAVWRHIAERPALGYGFATFWRTEIAQPTRYLFGVDNGYSHNGWLEIALDLGLVGAALLTVHVARVGLAVLRYARVRGEHGPALVFAFVFAHNLIEVSWWRTASTALLWITYLAVAVAVLGGGAPAPAPSAGAAPVRGSAGSRRDSDATAAPDRP